MIDKTPSTEFPDKRLNKIESLPTPKGYFILGHLPQFRTSNKHQILEQWAEELGDMYRINFLGREFLVSSNAAFNDKVLKSRPEGFRRFFKINEIFSEIGIVGVSNAEGETWYRHRKIISEALNLKKVRGFYPVILDKTQKMLKKWEHYSKEGKTIDVEKESRLFTIDITTEIAFGYELDTINNKKDRFQNHLDFILPMVNKRLTSLLPLWRIFPGKKDKDLKKSL